MMAEPPAKRPKTAPSAGGGCGEAVSLPGSRMLRQTMLVLLFLVRVSVRSTDTVTASFAQIGTMVQAHVDRAFHKYHEMISSKLESFQGQIEGLHREVRHLARLCSNRYADQQTRVEPNQEYSHANGSNANIQLRFLNGLRTPIYTEKNLTAENNAAIKVAMFEGDKMITSGPLSKVKVEVLVLRGDFSNNCRDSWTEGEFDKHIVQGRDGQGIMLGVNRTAWLTNGEAELSQIRFKEGSCRTPSRTFIMAVRLCKSERTSVRVREAIMKPVTVLDRRNEANEKRHPPRLDDDVYRLEEIAKDGVYHRRLQKENINTVEDFLKFLNKDSDKLCKIVQMEKRPNSWSKMITHAKECQEVKQYKNDEGNYFNGVHHLVGAAFDPTQKALVNKWKGRAYDKLESIPLDYVTKGNISAPISSSTDVAAGPSVLAVGASQPVASAEHIAAYQGYQGIGAAESSPRGEINHVIPPIYPSANDAMIATPGYLNTHGYKDQGTALLDQQPIISASLVPVCQQNPANLMNPYYRFECASINGSQFSAEWPLGDPFSASLMPGEVACSCIAMGSPQPWCAEHDQ